MAKLRVDKIAAPIVKDEFTGSVYFDGTGDYLSVADHSDLDFGTGDFTIEFWAYAKTSAVHDGYVSKRTTGSFTTNNQWRIAYNDTNDNINLIHASNTSVTAAAAPAPGQSWSHYAFARESGTMRVFKDGVLSTSATGWTYDFSNTYDLLIGANVTSAHYLDGYISNLRICKGHAVYTGNFTVPTRELEVHTKPPKGVVFPAEDNRTVLLACQDAYNPLTEATGRHTITGAGSLGGVPGQNLVTNGQFSQNTDNWDTFIVSGGISFVRDTTVFSNGGIKVTTSSGQALVKQTVTGLVSGQRYIFTADAYNPSGNSGTDVATISIVAAGYTTATAASTTVDDKIQKLSVLFTASGTSQIIYLSVVRADYVAFGESGNIGYFDNISVIVVTPTTEANPGLLRKTNITSTITENTGAVYFDGSGDYLKIGASTDFSYGNDDFTVESWIYPTALNAVNTIVANWDLSYGNNEWGYYLNSSNKIKVDTGTSNVLTSVTSVNLNVWTHVVYTRQSGTHKLYINGVLDVSSSTVYDYSEVNPLGIGGYSNAGENPFTGYISNLRICKGHAVYKSQFIPPTRELEVHGGPDDDRTVLLACYDGENIFADKSGRHIIAAYGDRLSSPTPTATDSPIGSTTVTPGLTRNVDPVDGPTFQGGAGYTSQNWLTIPKGTTEQRGGTRGLTMGGLTSNSISFIQVQTQGNAQDFGDLSSTVGKYTSAAFSSSTRSFCAGGELQPGSGTTDAIEYVYTTTTGNVVDFGNLLGNLINAPAGLANSTRGVVAGGYNPSPASSRINTIQYITMASFGDAQTFGELANGEKNDGLMSYSSPTRGIFAGGNNTPAGTTDSIHFITIASIGNASDFGDLTTIRTLNSSCSNSIRGLVAGSAPVSYEIEYVTISTLGSAKEFGDLLVDKNGGLGGMSSSTRGVFAGGSNPTSVNIIDFVEISTTGTSKDFGDLIEKQNYTVSTSNGHGGLG